MKMTRLLSLLLCLTLLCGTMLGTVASAADFVNEVLVEEVITADSTMAIEKDPNGMVYFETIDDLYELVSKKYDTMTNSYCPNKLVISKSITIPENFEVFAEEIVITEDATVVVNGFLGARLFTVQGSVVNNELFYTNEHMEITGHVQNNASFNLFYIGNDITLIGSENITHSEGNALVWQCWLTSGVLLEKAVQNANQHPEWYHYVYTSDSGATLYLENSITLPENLEVVLMAPTTINMADGAVLNIGTRYFYAAQALEINGDIKLTGDGMLSIAAPSTINGNVENGAILSVYTQFGGRLKLNGNYTERPNGALAVVADSKHFPEDAVTGVSMLDFVYDVEEADGMYVKVMYGYVDSSEVLTPGASVPMFRMYDPNSSEHFYTGSKQERNYLLEAGWNYEGVGFNFPAAGEPVYRLYHKPTGEHLYTMNTAEVDALLAAGWTEEGVAFNSAGKDEVPQYRMHNPNATRGAYHFTGSEQEKQDLLDAGWEYQGIGWYSCLH